MKILTQNLLSRFFIDMIFHDTYTGNKAFIYEGECIHYYTNNAPKEIIECFKTGESRYSHIKDFGSSIDRPY